MNGKAYSVNILSFINEKQNRPKHNNSKTIWEIQDILILYSFIVLFYSAEIKSILFFL